MDPPADRPTLVLLHGLGGAAVHWRTVLPHLGDGLDVRTLALPGHHGGPVTLGRSSPTLAGVVAATQRALAVELDGPAHLAGVGLGGRLALELARAGHARSVCAIAPLGGWVDAHDVRRLVKLMLAARGAILGEGAFWQLMVTKPRVRRVALRTSLEHADAIEVETLEALRTAMESCVGHDALVKAVTAPEARFPTDADPFEVPVRLVWGKKDRLTPYARYGRPVAAALGGPELVVLLRAGHLAPLDEPEAVARELLATVAAAEAATPSREDRRASG